MKIATSPVGELTNNGLAMIHVSSLVPHSLTHSPANGEDWTAMVRRALPEPARPHCLGARYAAGVLSVYCDGKSWATLIHWHGQALCMAMASPADDQPPRLRIVTMQSAQQPAQARRTRQPLQLSPGAGQLLAEVAANLDDARLAGVLQRIAARRQPR